jgi:hypothetical protein
VSIDGYPPFVDVRPEAVRLETFLEQAREQTTLALTKILNA